MSSEENRKRLERQARSLMTLKEISQQERDRLNAIMRDKNISPEEKYTSMIRLLRKLPDREILDLDDTAANVSINPDVYKEKNRIAKLKTQGEKKSDSYADIPDTRRPFVNGPTETSLYIDDIYIKYRRFRLYKKRRLVERNNWFGFGFNKRLIPAKKFMEIFSLIRSYQETLLARLPSLLDAILKSEDIDSPVEYNYLKMLRRWVSITPFASVQPHRIKWMEQWGFERELRGFTMNHYSFLKIELKQREELLAFTENLLREQPDLLKEEISEDDDKGTVARKENSNYRKEKEIYDYMGAMRSFVTIPGENDSLLAAELRKRYDIYSLTEFINMSLEALVFQRPFAITEIRDYYDIRPAAVSSEIWDCSPEKLKSSGKDPESKRKKRIEKLTRDLQWFDTVSRLVNIDENGQNLITKSVEEQWKLADRVNRDAADSLKKNFIIYLEGAVHYFRDLLLQVLDGSPLLLEKNGVQREAAIFNQDYFREEIRELESLLDTFFTFRNHNPTLKISDDEVKKIMLKKISSMDHVETLIYKGGSVFYAFGKKLHEVYHRHIFTEDGTAVAAKPLSLPEAGEPDKGGIPFADFILRGVAVNTPLIRRIAGQRILSESKRGGIYIFILAFCYQVSNLCVYPMIQNDITKRDLLKREITELKGDTE
ncbi:MAG TPA: hypothetical protein PKZ64_04305 [Spirochaetota bacterium]|nr:hypothetical protein [Spirochaetota bacterium]HPJ41005.1 hypothetical protein [Spirochaetota bacterium]HPR37920.1 hypothetical protein [Spirochaetota bacterium]